MMRASLALLVQAVRSDHDPLSSVVPTSSLLVVAGARLLRLTFIASGLRRLIEDRILGTRASLPGLVSGMLVQDTDTKSDQLRSSIRSNAS
jgi:hypothetical protein